MKVRWCLAVLDLVGRHGDDVGPARELRVPFGVEAIEGAVLVAQPGAERGEGVIGEAVVHGAGEAGDGAFVSEVVEEGLEVGELTNVALDIGLGLSLVLQIVQTRLADEVLLVAGGGVAVPVGLVDGPSVVEEGDAVDVLDVEAEAAGEGGLRRFAGVNLHGRDVGLAEALEEEIRVVGGAAADPHDDLVVLGWIGRRRGGAAGRGEQENAGAEDEEGAQSLAHWVPSPSG